MAEVELAMMQKLFVDRLAKMSLDDQALFVLDLLLHFSDEQIVVLTALVNSELDRRTQAKMRALETNGKVR